MKKLGRIFVIIVMVLQSIAPNIASATEAQLSKEHFNFENVEFSNNGEDVNAIVKGSYTKTSEDESVDKVHVSDNVKLADSSNNPLVAVDGSTKGTYDISNNVITLKATSAGTYSVQVKLAGKYNLDSQNTTVNFTYGSQSVAKQLTGLESIQATAGTVDNTDQNSDATAKESETDKQESTDQSGESADDEADPDADAEESKPETDANDADKEADKSGSDAEVKEDADTKNLKTIPEGTNLVTYFSLIINPGTDKEQVVPNGGEGEIELDGKNALQLEYGLTIPDDIDISEGDTYKLPLPSIFKDATVGKTIPLNVDDKEIGSYTIQGGEVVITFSNGANDFDGKNIQVNISGILDEEVFENQDEVDVKVPYAEGDGYESTIKVKPKDFEGEDKKTAGQPYIIGENGEKVYTNKNPEYVDWTVRANDSVEDITDAKVIDKLGDNLEIVPDSFIVEKIIKDRDGKDTGKEPVTGLTPEIKDPGFELNLGSISDAYDITYTTKITRPDGGGKLTINNDASIILDGDDKDYSDNVDVEFSNDIPTIQKDGAVSSDRGDIVNWTVKYNFGKQNIGIVNLTDNLDKGTIDLDTIKVTQVDTNVDGNVVPGSEKVVTVTPTTDDQGNVVLPDLDADGKAYLITFDSEAPVGTKGSITNVISDDKGNSDDAKVDVDTIPTGGKVGEQHVDKDGNPYIEWTITMNTNKVDTPSINIKDVFNQEFLKFDSSDTSLYDLYQDGEKVDSSTYTLKDYEHKDGRKGFELNINPAGAHEFKFVYRTYYTVAGMRQPNLANHAELIFDDGNGGTIGPGEGIDFKQTGPKAGIKKTGKYVYDSEGKQVIEWTVTFNKSKILLDKDSKIVDDFTSGNYEYIDSSLSIVTDNGTLFTDYGLDTNSPNPGFTINLTKATKETLKVTYRTTADDAANKDQTNKATLRWQGGDETADATVGKRDPGISKEGKVVINKDGSKSVNWTIKFNINKNIIYNFELKDQNTPNTVIIDKNSIEIKNDAGDVVTGDFEITDPANGAFTVKKDKLENTKYTLTYTTSLSPEEEAQEVKNIANIEYRGGKDKAEANVPKPELGVRKTAESLDKKSNPKVITWKIIANTDENNKFVNLQNAKLTDTIPADQKLVKGSVEVKRVGSDDTLSPDAIEEEDNKFTVKLPDGPYQYEVTLQTTIESYPSVNEKIDRYTNKVTLSNDNYEDATADAYQDYFADGSNNKSAKTGTVNDDTENVDWELTVNPAGLPISNAKITDNLGEKSRSTYVPGSITVDNVDNNKAKIELADDNKSFVITFDTPDGKINEPVKISYSTKVDADVIGFVTVTNTVSLTGRTAGKEIDTTTSSTDTSQWTYGGGGSGRTLELNVNKESNNGINIPNTEFKIVRLSNSGAETVVAESIKTNGGGLINIDKQRAGRYIITELSVPEGYEKLTAPLYVIVGYDKDGKSVITYSDSKWSTGGTKGTKTVVVTNNVVKGNIEATKVWENGPNDKPTVWFQLYRNVEGETPEPVDGEAIKQLDNGTTKVNWDGLELYKELGNGKTAKYIYSVKEVDKDGNSFVPEDYKKTEDGLKVTNSYVIPKTDVTGTKVWENGSKPAIQLQLVRDGKALEGEEFTVSLDGSEETPWTHTWTGLDKTDINGKEYKYTVDEVEVPDNYEKTVSEDGLTVTNKFVSPKIDIPVEKVWNDADNQDGNRPDSIEVELLANGEKTDVANITLNSENQWKASFSELPTLDNQGKEITYTVNEISVPSSYKSETSGDSAEGFTITNSYTPGKINVKVNKVWDDSNNQDLGLSNICYLN
ncbi:collagen binding domain-containing protein [Bavariicoccus seileri]|uniref:collagen binding domain-containing protein n=1 Tax=Bavariicoccus seileri TaxID=549685 RepID=UPI0003B6B39A|nr:collagen binding domain-containing protein [Bavariicoccus seileri]